MKLQDLLVVPESILKRKKGEKSKKRDTCPYYAMTEDLWRQYHKEKEEEKLAIERAKKAVENLRSQQAPIKLEIAKILKEISSTQLVLREEKAELKLLEIKLKKKTNHDNQNLLREELENKKVVFLQLIN